MNKENNIHDIEETKKIIKRIQEIVFGIMCDIDDFCRENNIRYFLSGGTCLGAVRHHGFIPWDDDADLMMPRKDYERFLDIFPSQFANKYGTGSFSIDPNWKRQYARVWDKNTIWRSTNLDDLTMGVFVDIFPIDGLPDNQFCQKIYYICIRLLGALGSASAKKRFLEKEKFRIIKRIIRVILKPFNMRFFTMKMKAMAKKYDFETSNFVGASMADHYGEKETIKKEAMSSEILLPFEGRTFPVPKGYKAYLSNLYGDYMKIPKDTEENGYSHLDHWEVEFSIN